VGEGSLLGQYGDQIDSKFARGETSTARVPRAPLEIYERYLNNYTDSSLRDSLTYTILDITKSYGVITNSRLSQNGAADGLICGTSLRSKAWIRTGSSDTSSSVSERAIGRTLFYGDMWQAFNGCGTYKYYWHARKSSVISSKAALAPQTAKSGRTAWAAAKNASAKAAC
jgi:hypothetical protein